MEGKIQMNEMIYDFIYTAAMRDATLQLSYSGEKKWLTQSKKFLISGNALKGLVDGVINGKFEEQEEYDKRMLDVSKKICDKINRAAGNKEFTFGNAQKLINIIMKYFYICTYNNDTMKKSFRFCHCPMDSQLLNDVWKNRKLLAKPEMLGKQKEFVKSWGKEDFDIENGTKVFPERYKRFQEAINELAKAKGLTRLEYDYVIWGRDRD